MMQLDSQVVGCPVCAKAHTVFGAWCEDGVFAFEWECVGEDGCGVLFDERGVAPRAELAAPVAVDGRGELPWWVGMPCVVAVVMDWGLFPWPLVFLVGVFVLTLVVGGCLRAWLEGWERRRLERWEAEEVERARTALREWRVEDRRGLARELSEELRGDPEERWTRY